jgi:uncharacterized protein (DUF302 family)
MAPIQDSTLTHSARRGREEAKMTEASYGYTRTLGRVPFSEAERRVTEALKSEGFGVLTEIDVKATLKKKIDVDFRPYKILGACNPPLAHRALSAERLIGLLMPCNVVILEEDDQTITVSIAKPAEMFKPVNNPELSDMVHEVEDKLQRVLERMG